MEIGSIIAKGVEIDPLTGCAHYRSPHDVIAIKHYCCKEYYACIHCHEKLAGHENQVWPTSKLDELAVLCGNCDEEMTIMKYMNCESRCPNCSVDFNPGCRNHWHYYFES